MTENSKTLRKARDILFDEALEQLLEAYGHSPKDVRLALTRAGASVEEVELGRAIQEILECNVAVEKILFDGIEKELEPLSTLGRRILGKKVVKASTDFCAKARKHG